MLLMKRLFLVLWLLVFLSMGLDYILVAQPETGCDPSALIEHQQEHAARIADLEHAIQDDLDTALENLYITGVAYQVLAIDCGFNRFTESVTAHAAEHEANTAQDDRDRAAIVDAARAIGDPDNGEILFNTMKSEVGFACATCHRVDTTESLIGPGLLGVGNPEHDPSEHDMDAMNMEEEGGHGESETDGEMSMDDEAGGHAMHTETSTDDSEMADRVDSAGPVEYIRTSILHPSAFLVPGFPDNLMPKTYGEIFTEDEINDLIAYLMTLQ